MKVLRDKDKETAPFGPYRRRWDRSEEARRGPDFLNPEGVIALLQASLSAPTLRGIGQSVLDGARTFAGGSLQDDACLVLARRL